MSIAYDLHTAVAQVAPIFGVSVGDTVEIQFRPEATKGQRDAAMAVAASFDPAVAEKQRQIDQAKTLPLRDKAVILAVAEVLGIDSATLIEKVESHITTEAAKS